MVHILFKAEKLDYEKIKKFIKMDNLIIYPTDTVYGIGARIDSQNALEKIYKAKSRDFSSPLIALISHKENIYKIARVTPAKKEKLEKLVEKFWPGGLTIILKKKENVPGIMVSYGETVGIRMPDHEVALKIIESAGGVFPTTSANISGEHTPKSYEELSDKMKSKADIIIDGKQCPVGTESTIIDLSNRKIKVLRVGAISVEEIEAVIGKI